MKILNLFIAIFLFATGTTNLGTSQQQTKPAPDENFISYLSKLKLPDHLDFCGEPVPLEIPEVRERAEREFYLNLQSPGQLILYVKRSARYFQMFQDILKENNMPDDIKYLSVAESALYMSRSTKDAVGLWQFIPSTGKAMGLQIDENVDERRHPEKSTRAAFQYLKQGYSAFKSWTMAAAGYNMGFTNLEDNTDFQNKKNFYDLYLNEETSRYIFRIVIIKEILSHPEKYGIVIDNTDTYRQDKVKIVKLACSVPSLAKWAEDQGSSYKELKLLNPWLISRKLPAPPKNKIYEIALPEK